MVVDAGVVEMLVLALVVVGMSVVGAAVVEMLELELGEVGMSLVELEELEIVVALLLLMEVVAEDAG